MDLYDLYEKKDSEIKKQLMNQGEQINISNMISDCISLFKPSGDVKQQIIKFDDIDIKYNFFGNPKILRLMLNVVMDNAIKFGQRSSVIIWKLEIINSKTQISVSNFVDDIEKFNLENAFEAKHRTMFNNGGSHIALSVVRKILYNMDGEIELIGCKRQNKVTATITFSNSSYG